MVTVQKASKSGQTESHAPLYKRRCGSMCVLRLLWRSIYVISNSKSSGQVAWPLKSLSNSQ